MPVEPALKGVLATYSNETRELCRVITRELLALERGDTDPEKITASFTNITRALHTLKGGAATLRLDDLTELAHRMEDALAPLREARHMPSASADAFLQGLDAFNRRIRAHVEGAAQGLPELAATLALFEPAKTETAPSPEAPIPKSSPPEVDSRPEEAGWWVRPEQFLPLTRDAERLQELRLRLEQRIAELDAALSVLRHPVPSSAGISPLEQLEDVRDALKSDQEEASELAESLEQGLQGLSTAALQTVLEPLQRGVRDLARRAGVEAQLSVVGGELSLDRRLLSPLAGMLGHLVRNAVDHGLELPAERERQGKHRVGALLIRAERLGNMVVLEVADDGGGLDTEAIRKVALSRGLMSAEKLAAMTAAEMHQLIFRTGFSTRSEVTETSGRGVGLDVVRSQVLDLSGQLEVHSTPRQGTRFLLTLPADLGTTPVLVVRAGEHRLGLPLSGVESVCTTAPESLIGGFLELHEERLPLVDLCARLHLLPGRVSDELRVVILLARGRRLALLVDAIENEQDLTLRPLPPTLRNLPAYQGTALLPGGTFLPVLRVDWLATETSARASQRGRRILVVDDSLTARALHRTVLEAGGFRVHTSASGPQALELLSRAPFDLVVADVSMAEMNGHAFTSRLRAQPSTRNLPVLLVSARDTEEAQQAGLGSGADAFLSKRECRAGRLLEAVEDLLAQVRVRA
ncbi:hybrid sensor histidine kinase/response regulator [Hyalangium versicolor]|uniref:hybrid sensor histidine kinase/response regulator n=1 Tax=Hyalangium versicolor TaxID=2861190 RepID=UPI001CCAA4E9|nr:hybrid sensor histidine kinase/response regulator [Hyalangium versicolor]